MGIFHITVDGFDGVLKAIFLKGSRDQRDLQDLFTAGRSVEASPLYSPLLNRALRSLN